MRIRFGWAILVIVGLAAGCSRAGFDRNQMTEGERLFRANCRNCHVLPKPNTFTDEKWPEFLADHGSDSAMSKQARSLITGYLIDNN